MMEHRIIKILLAALVVIITFNACYYDKAELLSQVTICDTTQVTFTQNVEPVISSNCASCHNNVSPDAGIPLTTHAQIAALASERFLGAIEHSAGYSPMPKGAAKLNACSITKIKNWINQGKPNN